LDTRLDAARRPARLPTQVTSPLAGESDHVAA
jgi:hypothetical protein